MTLSGGDGGGRDAFYLPDGDAFVATELTRGPWQGDMQHAGPPAALIGRAVENTQNGEGKRVARITYEILQPVPITTVEVTTRVVRPGRRVDLIEATLTADGEPLILARAWRMLIEKATLPTGTRSTAPLAPPSAGQARPFFETGYDVGYHTAMDVRFVRGEFRELGPAAAWMRMRVGLIAGEEPSPLVRVLVAADTGNGISAVLDHQTHVFVNTDLTVHLHRLPRDLWVRLDAETTIDADGIGLATSTLSDEDGTIGRALQTLYVRARE
jgi:hypothetical protein